MSTTSASRAEAGPAAADDAHAAAAGPIRRVLVWDAPVRVFHWLAVLCFAGAWLTADSERWRLLHVTLGLTLAALVAFRVVWGLVGTRHARFASFVRGPRAVAHYLGSLLRGTPERHLGHNPAGALAIVGLLGLAGAVTASGWLLFQGVGGEVFEDVHEALATGLLVLVGVHVLGVVVSSALHRENLVGAMLSGRKAGDPTQGARRAWRGVAALMLMAVLAFWWQQSLSPLVGGGEPVVTGATTPGRGEAIAGAGGHRPAGRGARAEPGERGGRSRGEHRDDD